jgi:hypothetical protein
VRPATSTVMPERWPTKTTPGAHSFRTVPAKNGSKESDLACSPTLSATAGFCAKPLRAGGVPDWIPGPAIDLRPEGIPYVSQPEKPLV